MSSIVLKLGSLVIKTLAKPIANTIKAQAREHERFRRFCISFAQSVHRIDMRLRLGLLQDTATMEKQAARAAAEAQAKKTKRETSTVKTEAQMKADETAILKEKDKDKNEDKAKSLSVPKPKIRPLSEAKAIDSGASFVSEGFLMLVGVSMILVENWRTKRREHTRREDVTDRISELEESEKVSRRALVELEKEILQLRRKNGIVAEQRILPQEVWEAEVTEEKEENKSNGWGSWIGRLTRANTENKFEVSEPSTKNSSSEKPTAKENDHAEGPESQSRLSPRSLLQLDSSTSKTVTQHTEPTS